MILIKTKDRLINFYNCILIENDDSTDTISVADNSSTNYIVIFIKNKEIREKVYNIIQDKLIDFNAKNENGHIDVETIIKQVKDTKTDDRIYYN